MVIKINSYCQPEEVLVMAFSVIVKLQTSRGFVSSSSGHLPAAAAGDKVSIKLSIPARGDWSLTLSRSGYSLLQPGP